MDKKSRNHEDQNICRQIRVILALSKPGLLNADSVVSSVLAAYNARRSSISISIRSCCIFWLRRQSSNLRPLEHEF